MGAGLIIRKLENRDYAVWTRLVAASLSGSIYALPEYLDILCGATGGSFSIFGVFSGNELVGGMPLYTVSTKAGPIATDRSLLYYHSPVIRQYATRYPSEKSSRELAVLSLLEEYLRGCGVIHLVMYFPHALSDVRPFLMRGWHIRPDYTYVVPLKPLDDLWGRIDYNLRRLIERAGKSGLTHTEDDDFDSFYRLHTQTRRRKRLAQYLPEKAFRHYFERLKAQNLCRLYHTRLPDGSSVAAQLVLTGPHPVSHTVCAASDAHHLSMGENPYLRWKAFESLACLGYAANDLSGTPHDDVSRFKRQLGGDLAVNWWVIRPETVRYRLYKKARSVHGKSRRIVRRMFGNVQR